MLALPNTGAGGFAFEYVSDGPAIAYPIVHGAHVDQDRMLKDDYKNGNVMTLAMQYYDPQNPIVDAWVAHRGEWHKLPRYGGNAGSGFYQDFFDYPQPCEPYYFAATTQDGRVFRLPEEEHYVFGSAWSQL